MARMRRRTRNGRTPSNLPPHNQVLCPASALTLTATTSVVLVAGLLLGATAFTIPQRWLSSSSSSLFRRPVVMERNLVLFSSVGDGDGGIGNGGGGGGDDNGDLGDFLDPMKKPDSEDMKRAREYMSETSLPISFDTPEETASMEEEGDDAERMDADLMMEGSTDADTPPAPDASSSLVSSASVGGDATSSALFVAGTTGEESEGKGPPPSLLAKNPYMQVVSKISPSDLIAKFTAESDPRVQEAVRTTILGLIGSLPKLAFETTSVTTGQRLASLVSETKEE